MARLLRPALRPGGEPIERERPDSGQPDPEETRIPGQGEQENTTSEEVEEESSTIRTSYASGTATGLNDPVALAREDEGMDR